MAGYVLDGIETAMVEVYYEGCDGSRLGPQIECPCGWIRTSYLRNDFQYAEWFAALRFHYTNCEQAKPSADPSPKNPYISETP